MNSDTRAFQRKFTTTSTVLSAVLPRTARARPWQIALTSLNVSLGNYLIGDLLIRPRYGRTVSVFTDGIGAGVITGLTSRFLPGMRVGTLGVLASAGAVGLAEWFSAGYLDVFNGQQRNGPKRAIPIKAIPIKRRNW